MRINTRQTIPVQFAPDRTIAVVVQFADTVRDSVGHGAEERAATLDQRAGQALVRQACAWPALVDHLLALRGEMARDRLTGDEGRSRVARVVACPSGE